MKRKITALLATLAILLAIPTAATAHYEDGTIIYSWGSQPSGSWQYWIPVCDVGFSDGAQEDRIQDALAEWNEGGGELHYSWSNWSDSTCTTNFNSSQKVVKIQWVEQSGNLLGQAFPSYYGSGCLTTSPCSIIDCNIYIDGDGWTDTQAWYSWYTGTGTPSANQIDLESVLVHEFGHCSGLAGHSIHNTAYVMHECLGNPCGQSEGVEKDELLTHDRDFWNVLYN